MKIATAPSRNSKRWRTQEVSWDWLLDKLRQPVRTGETVAEWGRMSRDEKAARKDVGGFVGGALEGGRRINGAVRERWLLTLDADDARPDDWEEMTGLYDWRMAVYSTHSHTPQRPRLRWIIPLRRAVTPEEYQACARKMAELIGIETMDPTTYQPERLMYWPSCSVDAEYVFEWQDGMILSPDELLRMYGPGEAWKDVSLWPMGSREQAIVQRSAKKQGDPTTKPGLVGKFCRAYDVPEAIDRWLSDVYEECEGTPGGQTRYTYKPGSSSGGAVLYEDGAFLYSHHSTDPAGGQLLNAFDLVRVHLFGAQDEGREAPDDVTKLPSYKAMCSMVTQDGECKRRFFAEDQAEANAAFADLGEVVSGEQVPPEGAANGADQRDNDATVAKSATTGSEKAAKGAGNASDKTDISADNSVIPGDNGDVEPDMSWVEQLAVNHKTGEADPTIQNALLIMENDPRIAGKMAMNDFSGRPTIRGPLPWKKTAQDGDLWEDADEASLRWYLEVVYKFKGKDKINDALQMIMKRNAFHPVREYLDGLRWDGVERLDTCLIRYLDTDDTAYVRAVTRKWMCAAVKRVYEPGCKFDSMLLIMGEQNIGKSMFARTISRGWFTDSVARMDGKEAYESVRGRWIVEIAELAAARKSEQEAQKQFLSAQSDYYRPAYGKNLVEFRRQCVFYGTTNDPEPLKDDTGGRRYWIVRSHRKTMSTLPGLREEVDQLWAEAVVRYRQGENLWLDDELIAGEAKEIQAANTYRDEWIGIIQEYLDKPITPDWEEKSPEDRAAWIQGDSLEKWEPRDLVRREQVSATEIRVECFGEDRAGLRGNDFNSRRISRIMGQMPGWKRVKTTQRVPGYGSQRVYRREGFNPEEELMQRLLLNAKRTLGHPVEEDPELM